MSNHLSSELDTGQTSTEAFFRAYFSAAGSHEQDDSNSQIIYNTQPHQLSSQDFSNQSAPTSWSDTPVDGNLTFNSDVDFANNFVLQDQSSNLQDPGFPPFNENDQQAIEEALIGFLNNVNGSVVNTDLVNQPIQSTEFPSCNLRGPGEVWNMAAPSPQGNIGQGQASIPAQSPGLLTQQWTVPPRPKPGRKPADDSPISKRKAQNRQAQRNFRERKAKKVDELEAEMARMKEQFNFTQTALVQQHEVDRIQKDKELAELRDRFTTLTERLTAKTEEVEKLKQAAVVEKAKPQQRGDRGWQHPSMSSTSSGATGSYDRFGSFQSTATSHSSFSLPSPTSVRPFPLTLPTPNQSRANSNVCGTCGSRPGICQCVEKRLRSLPDPNQPEINQQTSPTEQQHAQSPQKQSFPVQQPTPSDEMEIDFTASYSRHRPQLPASASFEPREVAGQATDHCGFCTDDANCVCREAAAATAAKEEPDISMKDDSSSHQTSVTRSTSSRPQPMEPKVFLTEPGNCPSCRADPAKANFCRSLAAMRTPSILQHRPAAKNFISCSDAFDKLRDDPMFATASEAQRQTMMRQLNQRQRVPEPGRTPLEVEDASLLLSLSSAPSENV